MPQPWDYIAKLVCIGDSSTGKSSLTIRLCEGRFSNLHDVTIGVEFGSRIVPVGPPASAKLNLQSLNSSSSTRTTPHPSRHGSTIDTLSDPHRSKASNDDLSTLSSTPAPSLPPPPTLKSVQQAQQKHMKLSLWDTAGQETYKSITRSYFRGASGALLVFDLTRRATFDSVTQWLHDLRQIAEEGIVVVLVGNKLDLAEEVSDNEDIIKSEQASNARSEGNARSSEPLQSENQTKDNDQLPPSPTAKRAISRAEATAWCRQHGVFQYIETSAKSGAGVERAFLEVAERIYQNIEAGRYDLNDRRSGVKSASGASGGMRGRGTGRNTLGGRGRSNNSGQGDGDGDGWDQDGTVVLGMNKVGGMGVASQRWGSCC